MALQTRAEASRPGTDFLEHVLGMGADAAWILDRDRRVTRSGIVCDNQPEDRSGRICMQQDVPGHYLRTLPSGVEIWAAGGRNYFAARVPASGEGPAGGFVVAAYRASTGVLERLTTLQPHTHPNNHKKPNLPPLTT